MRRCLCLLAFAALSTAFAPAPLPRPKPIKKVKAEEWFGSWSQVSSPTVTFVITPTTMAYHNPGGHINSYALTFDGGKSPKTYDISREGRGRLAFAGIYKVEGDTLTICYRGANSPRPTAFAEPGSIVEVFKRIKR